MALKKQVAKVIVERFEHSSGVIFEAFGEDGLCFHRREYPDTELPEFRGAVSEVAENYLQNGVSICKVDLRPGTAAYFKDITYKIDIKFFWV